VVLCNSANDIDDIGWHLLNPRFKLNSPAARQVATINYQVYDRHAGRYEFPFGGAFVITRDGDHLFAKLADQPTVEVCRNRKQNSSAPSLRRNYRSSKTRRAW